MGFWLIGTVVLSIMVRRKMIGDQVLVGKTGDAIE
jgi:hypothetical protein